MLGHAIPDIPRIYTAIAEWLSCGMFVLLLGPKIKGSRLAIFGSIYLLLLIIFMELTATITLLLWLPCMICAFISMAAFIGICNRTTVSESIFYAIMAFSVAECIASLL